MENTLKKLAEIESWFGTRQRKVLVAFSGGVDSCLVTFLARKFLGKENDMRLRKWLFESNLKELIPIKLIEQYYINFKQKDTVVYSHPVSMLLTLALFNEKLNKLPLNKSRF